MNTDTTKQHDQTAPQAADQSPVQSSRRKLIGGTASGVGVLMAVSAKTALGGGVCQSPSAMMSGNTSPNRDTPPPCSGGRSPGFWKVPKHFPSWVGASYATLINTAPCPTGLGGITPRNIGDQGTLVVDVFPTINAAYWMNSYSYQQGTTTVTIQPHEWGLWAALAFNTVLKTPGDHNLLFHLIAAYLNSLAFSDYALTTAEVQHAANLLLNGLSYCPSGMPDCGVKAMNAEQFVGYISGMYDINADLPETTCTTD